MFSISISHEKIAKIACWKIRENKAVLWCLTIDNWHSSFSREKLSKIFFFIEKLTELAWAMSSSLQYVFKRSYSIPLFRRTHTTWIGSICETARNDKLLFCTWKLAFFTRLCFLPLELNRISSTECVIPNKLRFRN